VLGGLAVLGVLWWSWASHAWLANQQVADRGAVRVGILSAIAIVLVLSIAIPEVYPEEGGSVFGAMLFAVGFVVLSLVYTVVNLVVARRDPALRRQVLRTMGITIVPVTVALVAGALLGGTAQLLLWLAAVAVYGITVYTTSRGGQWQLPSTAHYAERHGLVVILALGESIISIGLAASHSALTVLIVVASLAAVSVTLGMWWVYFGRVSPSAERNRLDVGRPANSRSHHRHVRAFRDCGRHPACVARHGRGHRTPGKRTFTRLLQLDRPGCGAVPLPGLYSRVLLDRTTRPLIAAETFARRQNRVRMARQRPADGEKV
jgi:low temperature requirement protein LtrA